MKVIIASDKFKGSLSSKEVAECIEEGILEAMPDCSITKLFVADGGDGTAEAVVDSLHGEWQYVEVHDPLQRKINGRYGIIECDTVVLDVATSSGIALLKPEEYNALDASSAGTGELIKDAIERGFRKFLIGVGGSATTDAATGLLSALGFRFLDKDGNILSPCGRNLSRICAIDECQTIKQLKDCEFTVLSDVDASFYGKNGAAYLFAPQKGATKKDVEFLDTGLQSFAKVLKLHTGKSVQNQSYAGAAGAIGGSLWALLNAKLTPGIYTILKTIHFETALNFANLVVTGEGAMDKLTLLGKTPYGVCGEAAWNGVPTVAFVGQVNDLPMLNEYGFLSVFPIQPGPIDLRHATEPKAAAENLKQTVIQVFRALLISQKVKR